MTTDAEVLGQALLDRALWVYERLGLGLRLGVPVHEATLTQDLLLDLRQALPGLVVRTFSQIEEGKNGADWEWWWQGRERWFGARVQAKRLVPVTAGLFGYGFYYPYSAGQADRVLQVDKLIASAAAVGLPAVYALYNGPEVDLDLFPWRCPHLPPLPGVIGVATLPAETVRYVVNMGYVEQHVVLDRARP